MNEKYVQALIVGTLIGGSILFDDYVKPKKETDIKKMIIKSDYKSSDISDLDDIQELDLLQNMNVLEGLDLENLEDLEDIDEKIKVEVKNKNKEEN